MSILNKIFSSGVAEPIKSAGEALDKLFTSDDERLSKEALLKRIEQQPLLMQAEINKEEAKSASKFKGSWRSAVGWVCAISLGCYFIPQYLIGSFLWAKLCLAQGALVSYPLKPDGLLELVVGMLGLGLYKTVDKFIKK